MTLCKRGWNILFPTTQFRVLQLVKTDSVALSDLPMKETKTLKLPYIELDSELIQNCVQYHKDKTYLFLSFHSHIDQV